MISAIYAKRKDRRCCNFGYLLGSSKPKHNAGGKPEVVLSMAEESGVQFIPLHPPGDALDQFVVESTADSSGQGRVGVRNS